MTTIVIIGLLLLTGCAAGAPDASPSTAAAGHATPAPTPAAVPGPASQFPATCGQLVSDVQAGAALGATSAKLEASPAPSALDPLDDARGRQAGSMLCLWDAGTARLGLQLHRHAVLLARGPYGEVGFFGVGSPIDIAADRSTLYCGPGCSLDAQIGDYILSADIPDAAYRDQLVTLTAQVVARLAADPVPGTWTAPPGSWPSELDCAVVEASGNVAAALALGPLTVSDTTGLGSADTSVAPEIGHLGGVTDCTWADPSSTSGATLETLSGGGWAVDRLLATTTLTVQRQTIAHATRAATVCGADGRCALVVQVGVNALVLGDRQDEFGIGVAVPPDTLVAAGPAVVAGVLAAAG